MLTSIKIGGITTCSAEHVKCLCKCHAMCVWRDAAREADPYFSLTLLLRVFTGCGVSTEARVTSHVISQAHCNLKLSECVHSLTCQAR